MSDLYDNKKKFLSIINIYIYIIYNYLYIGRKSPGDIIFFISLFILLNSIY